MKEDRIDELAAKVEEVRNLVYSLVAKPSEIPELKEAVNNLSSELKKSIASLKEVVVLLLKQREKIVVEQDALVAKEIRDLALHRTEIVDIRDSDIVTIFVNNELDKAVNVQVKGNFTPTYVNSVSVGSAFTVEANSVEARNLSVFREAWLPFSFCEIVAKEVPTKGSIYVKYLKRLG